MPKQKVILGLNILHPDSSACLYIGNQLVGAVAEERLGKRIKHDLSFPVNSIRYLLKKSQLKVKDIDYVAVARDPGANKIQKLNSLFLSQRNKIGAVKRYLERKSNSNDILKDLASKINFEHDENSYQLVNVEHHIAHIAASYYTSKFDNAAAFSFDGSGDGVSVMFAECEENKIKVKKRIFLPASLGHFYTAMCQIIGFNGFGEEYKVMGLAPYGEDTYSSDLENVIRVTENGKIKLDPKYFRVGQAYDELSISGNGELMLGNLYEQRLLSLLGLTTQDSSKGNSKVSRDVAKSTQIVFEKIALQLLKKLEKISSSRNLCMGGGCALNGVFNAKIPELTHYENTHYHPAASDDGNCVGAALYVRHQILNEPRKKEVFSPYTGPSYADDAVIKAIGQYNLQYQEIVGEDELVNKAAKLIADNSVIAWYQGKAEWGPRALGNRSILANPVHPEMKDIINLKIKKRENFRPFAPSVLEELVSEYFEKDIKSPYMMHVVPFKPKYRSLFASVSHVDGTGRLQSVNKKINWLYYKLISRVKELTGYGIVLNTSFNENEPIVNTPFEALDCFIRTDIDAIFLNNYMITK